MKQQWIFGVVPWLWTVPFLVLSGFALWKLWRRLAHKRIGRFVSEKRFAQVLPAMHWRGHAWSFAVTVAVLILLALALARPLYGPLPDYAESKGVDFVVALDVSKSMWVEDVEPNRLHAVKKELGEWVARMAGDRMGLILFAGDAFVQAPITFDYKALGYVLQESGPKSVSLGGTNIPRALEMASGLLQSTDRGLRFLIIISDGENLEGDALGAVRAARAKDGITVFTVGVGTLAGGRVPVVDTHNPAARKDGGAPRKGFVSNEYGLGVTSRLDSRALRMLAEAGGGRYYEFRPGMNTFESLRNQSLLPMAQKNRGINVQEYREWFQIPLGCAILLLVLQALIPLVKKRANGKSSGVDVVSPDTLSKASGPRTMIRARKAAASKAVAGTVLLWVLVSPVVAQQPPLPPVEEAERLLAAGKKAEAVDFMRAEVQKDEKNPWLFYNYALTLYRAERYDESVTVFQALRQLPEGTELVERASVQMGNAQVLLGEKLKQASNWPGAILALERGLTYYDDSASQKMAADARNNRKRAEMLLEECLMAAGAASETWAEKVAGQLEAEEQQLRKALQAYERAAELNPKNEQAAKKVAEVREKLAQNLAKQAAEISKKTDAVQAAGPKKPEEVLVPRGMAVAKLDEALAFSPDNAPIQEQKKAEQNKISDFLTDQAEKQTAKIMEKPKLDVREQNTLSQAIASLDQAQALNPDNQKAADLNAKAKAKLEQSHVETGQAALADIDHAKPNPQAALNRANMAVDQFQKALGMNAENKPAQEGLKQAEARLPELYAAVGESEAGKAQDAMKGQQPPGKAQPAKPSTQDMQKAVGFLEKADQNYGMAVSLAPTSAELQKRAEEIRAMLTSTRDQLDQQSRANMTEPGTEQASAEGNESQPGEASEEANNTRQQLRSMSDLAARAKPNTGDNFWEKKIRDW